MDEKLMEPLKYYEEQGKEEHLENIKAHLDSLVTESGVDLEANRATVAKWKEEQATIKDLSRVLAKFKAFRTLLIIALLAGIGAVIGGIYTFGDDILTGVILLVAGLAVGIVSLMVVIKKVNPVIRDTDKVLQEHKATAAALEKEGWEQLSALNALFTDEDVYRLVEKTLPDFAFEKSFTKEQERLFAEKYDFVDINDDESSMLNTLSGKYAGNPFVYIRRKIHQMGTHTYHGSLVIHWTEVYRDSDGNVQTREHTQTLHASVTKPKPYYRAETHLLYGNQAAPDLSFSRTFSHIERKSDKSIERKVKSGEHKLQRQAARALKHGGSFQEMANSEFDVLFGANDRDNEVQFRFMYTPLGQRNTVALLRDDQNYGDDFSFVKQKRFNAIYSEHAQGFKMNVFAGEYRHFDYEVVRSRFINLNVAFFHSLFFDFAPFFSVPAYLDEPCASLESDKDVEECYRTNFPYYEHEVLANALGEKSFAHPETRTDAILKTKALSKDNGFDTVAVTAYSYATADRIDFVPVRGGDDNIHNVPVPWIEYLPIEKTTHVQIAGGDVTIGDESACYHGMNISVM